MIDYRNGHNEYVAIYKDECYCLQIMPFDTFTQALKFLDVVHEVVGVVTTEFWYENLSERV